MENNLFRKESLDRVTSPEQLQDYMRVTNPGIWMVLAAVIALLAGLIVLSCTQTLETVMPVEARADAGTVTVTLKADQVERVKAGMPLRIAGQETEIDFIYEGEDGLTNVTAGMDLPDGSYEAQIVTESIRPIRFLLND